MGPKNFFPCRPRRVKVSSHIVTATQRVGTGQGFRLAMCSVTAAYLSAMLCAGPCSKIPHGQVGVCGTAPATTGLSTAVTHFPRQGKLRKIYRQTRKAKKIIIKTYF